MSGELAQIGAYLLAAIPIGAAVWMWGDSPRLRAMANNSRAVAWACILVPGAAIVLIARLILAP